MRQTVAQGMEVVGFGALVSGVAVVAGYGVALIVAGVVLLAVSVVVSP